MTTTPNPLSALSNQLADAVERTAQSVVRVDDGSRFTATGVVWSEEGVIVSTSHGVERDEDLAVERDDGARVPATLVGRDPETDIAVLRIAPGSLPAITCAPTDSVRVGQLALAVARPGQANLHATLGLISARLESQTNGAEEYLLQTDAALAPGFSGGLLADMDGRMVGLINLMFRRGKGIALGTPVVQHAVEALLTDGRVRRGYLGIRTQKAPLSEALRRALTLSQEYGLLVLAVEDGSPAELGGLLMGDTLIALDGVPVEGPETLLRRLRRLRAGQVVVVRVVRGGTIAEFGVTLGAEA